MSDMITITGNVGTHPENKRTAAGVSITTFRVGSGLRRYDKASASWIDAGTNWYTVSAYRGLADHVFESIKRGDRVLLTGRLRVSPWDTGTKRGTDVEIDVDAIGHDLRWGTTRFEKAGQPRQDEEVEPGESDAWAAPADGAEESPGGSATITSWAVPPEEKKELALASAETPF